MAARRLTSEERTAYGRFRARVLAVVASIPRGRVLTYGDVAALAGRPHAAREVGWIAHASRDDLPWHRVVNRFGGLASGYEGGKVAQTRALRREGVRVRPDLTVDLARYPWVPGEGKSPLTGGAPGPRPCPR